MTYKVLKSFCAFVAIVVLLNCNRESLEPDPHALPRFSTDTVTFDTVFTTIGSATLNFKIYNRSNRPLVIQSISLAGGDQSFFRLNIDGESASYVNHVEIPPDDSLFVFVAVTVDPTNSNNPVVISDSVIFNTNGNLQQVKLIAYGQDVHLVNGRILSSQTWENDKPYLIYNSMAVDTGNTLTISAGTSIYFHNNSSLIVWGTLKVNGTFENPVVFRNDRLEEFYDIIPGQWGTLYFDPVSHDNEINYGIIENSIAGIQIGYPSDYSVPDLVISNSMIKNSSFAGIYAFGAEILCYNTVISNSAGPAIALLRGGDYRFLHCTISNNGVVGTSRNSPSVILTNFFDNIEDNSILRWTDDLLNAEFINSIIYGSYSHELQFAKIPDYLFHINFNHCLLKAAEDSITGEYAAGFTSVILNKDPAFIEENDRYHLNYELDTLSPAKDAGDPEVLLSYPFLQTDMNGNLRNLDAKPDLGAFERKED